MNEQAQKVLIDLIQQAAGGLDSAVAFSQAQVPEVVYQLLMWKITISIIWCICTVGMLALAVFLFKFIGRGVLTPKEVKEHNDGREKLYQSDRNTMTYSGYWDSRLKDTSDLMHSLFVLKCIVAGVAFILFLLMIDFDWLKIWLAPKFYLVEYAANFVKS